MHFIWEKHWAWRRWAQDKKARKGADPAQPGTKILDSGEFAVAAGPATTGAHTNGAKPLV